jgi:excisionase family DNA binding protein
MPKAQQKPKPKRPTSASKPAAEVLNLGEVATYLRLTEAAVLQLVEEQGLPARRAGDDWRFLLSAVQDWLSKVPRPASNNDAWRALAGVWKDDADFDNFVEEINKERKRFENLP